MSLEPILKAESVAIVGASRNETKRGYQTIRTLLDEKYEGRIPLSGWVLMTFFENLALLKR